jgi:hypothetical protein
MWTKRLFVTAAAIAVLAPSGLALAQSSTAEQEMEAQNERAEVKLAVPLTSTGAIDVAALLALVRDQLAAGAREIQFRGTTLTAMDVQNLLLSTSASQNLLAEIAALLPKDGVERKVTLRGAVDVRVTRQPDGTLRARIEDVNLGNLTAEQRAQLAQQLAALGFTRVEIRGVDSDGRRVRVELRADRGVARDDDHDRDRHEDRVADAGRGDRRGGIDRPDRMDRPQRAERTERAEHVDRPDRSGHH